MPSSTSTSPTSPRQPGKRTERSPWLYVCATVALAIGLFLVRGGGTIDNTARFPQLSLSGETNIVADNGSMWTFNGVPFCTNCGTAINPTDSYVPYRVDATTFGDSPLVRFGTNSIGMQSSRMTNTVSILAGAFNTGLKLDNLDVLVQSLSTNQVSISYTTAGNANFSYNVAPSAGQFTMGFNGSTGFELNPWAAATSTAYTLATMLTHTSGDLVQVLNNGNIRFKIAAVSGYAATGAKLFADDGTFKAFHLSSTNWDDSQVPEAMVRVGATAPTLANFNGGPVQTLQFQNNRDDTIMATVQMTHRWKQGTDIHPHVHWCETAATGAGTNVVWQLTYAWTNLNCAYPAYTTLKITNSVTGTNWFSQLSDFPDISGTGLLVSSIFVFELRRLANTATADDYNQNVAFLGFDIHHQVDSPGSDSELTKSW